MKILVFSDLHGNIYTFNKLLNTKEFKEADNIIFCGDIFGYYYHQDEIIYKMREINNLHIVLGNHDKMFIDMIDNKLCSHDLCSKYGKSYILAKSSISEENIEYIRKLPCKKEVILDNNKFSIQHGSIYDNINGRIYPDTEIDIDKQYNYIIVGHTHYKMKREIEGIKLINPGSIGQPRDGGKPSYVVIDTNKNTEAFYEIDYDKESLIREIYNNNETLTYLIEILNRES